MVGKPKSCSACRQAKTACDARSTTPNPCSRCKEKQLSCRFDKNFKRVSQRQIARNIANRVHILRDLLNGRSDEDRVASIQASATEPTSVISTSERGSEFQLGTFAVSSTVVHDLFQHFQRYYSIHAPFLQPIASLDRLALDSTLLF
ncbi:uncharacterized protein F4822DRAFT_431547 [Hypoxylon trugodes]|uniref:uncharacterized protein n=1 Tax=Hypoxylon trugodes TaxID=326681 RepID=UPI00219D37C3|nr:uncharacterized protein F4822DRAFT_431547 [Hypoxylon trugodes]KAI1386676.1 hypothetical protein F4822DRAFT_431547 [Hypoxylon trugodes]